MRQSTLPVAPSFSLVPSSKSENRNRQLIRQWALLKLLGRRKWTLKDLASELSFNERTIRRDLQCLEAAHFPITQDKNEDGLLLWDVLEWQDRPDRRGQRNLGKPVVDVDGYDDDDEAA